MNQSQDISIEQSSAIKQVVTRTKRKLLEETDDENERPSANKKQKVDSKVKKRTIDQSNDDDLFKKYRISSIYKHIFTACADDGKINWKLWGTPVGNDKIRRRLYRLFVQQKVTCMIQLLQVNTKNKNYLKIRGYCKSKDEIHNQHAVANELEDPQRGRTFIVVIPTEDNPSISLFATTKDEIEHEDFVTRQCRNFARNELKQSLDKTSAFNEMLRGIESLDDEMKTKGNYTQPQGKKTLYKYDTYRKIKSEIDTQNRESTCQMEDLRIKKVIESLDPKTAYIRHVEQNDEYFKPNKQTVTREVDIYVMHQGKCNIFCTFLPKINLNLSPVYDATS